MKRLRGVDAFLPSKQKARWLEEQAKKTAGIKPAPPEQENAMQPRTVFKPENWEKDAQARSMRDPRD